MKNIKVEYIAIFDEKNKISTTKKALSMLLQSDTNITIKNSEISYRNTKINYSVESGKISDLSHRFFHIQFVLDDISRLEYFEDFLKSVRVILNNNSSKRIETLWNDISYYYALKSYPLIYEIENLMRKLITKIMLVTIGVGWTRYNVPGIVKDSIKGKNTNTKHETEFLYQTDFIQLSNFLFEEYSDENIKNLFIYVKQYSSNDKLEVSELKKYIPKSNWERYFSKIVDCDYDYLKNRWEDLYDLRCKVAHNNQMNKADYNRINILVKEVKKVLNEAIENIDKLEVDITDRELISESMILTTNQLYGEFIMKWKELEEFLFHGLITEKIIEDNSHKNYMPHEIIRLYRKNNLLEENDLLKINDLKKIRNRIIHESDVKYSSAEIKKFMDEMDILMISIICIWTT